MLDSLLDEIPALGEVRREALLDRFGSVAALRRSTVEEIATVPGIGPRIAHLIFDHLATFSQEVLDTSTGELISPPTSPNPATDPGTQSESAQ